MPGDEFARLPSERFPASVSFSVAPEGSDRCSPPPPAPIPDRFVPSPRRTRRLDPIDRQRQQQRRTRYVPPAAHVPVERYVPRPPQQPAPLPIRAPFYCAPSCRLPTIRNCCPTSPAPARYVDFSRVSCSRPSLQPPPQLRIPCEPVEPPCCVQARRRLQPQHHEWRSTARLTPAVQRPQPVQYSAPSPQPGPSRTPPPSPRIIPPPPALRDGAPSTSQVDEEIVFRRSQSVIVKDYLKRETQNFFGVQPDNEKVQLRLWKDRRRRHAARTLGDLKPEPPPPQQHTDEDEISMYGVSGVAPREARALSSTSMPVPEEEEDLGDELYPPDMEKESVARLTLNGLAYLFTAVKKRVRQSTAEQMSRTFDPTSPQRAGSEEECDDVFYDSAPEPQPEQLRSSQERRRLTPVQESTVARFMPVAGPSSADDGIELRTIERVPVMRQRSKVWFGPGGKIQMQFLDRVALNADRRQFGIGLVGRYFRRSIRKSVTQDEEVVRQLDSMADYRPYFTWWCSTVQTLVLIFSLLCYGFGPIGFGRHTMTSQVLVKSLSLQQVEYEEPAGFWLGPRAADLIHLGAKFAPCMRKDERIAKAIAAGARRERDTACCIRNDDSGCVQSSKADCSNTISTWNKWSNTEATSGGRISGPVCGLDPKYCEAPASVAPFEWPDDITKWPICRKSRLSNNNGAAISGKPGKAAEHMACEVIGHPCCIGVHGQCVITTKEHCDFIKGYFHEEASLCSQISCLDDVCGMLPFMVKKHPDQLYRAWTSLFVHAGVLHLLMSLSFQWLLMRDLEKMAGPVRVASIYIGSGVAGNLASAIFEPYRAEVGPAGAHFGLLACLIVEVVNAWPILKHPRRSLTKLLLIVVALFIFGLLPWVDNFAHFFGFIFGFLLSFALLPFISLGPYERRRKIFLVWVCLLFAIILVSSLIAVFYGFPNYECGWCSYFSCVPLARDMCSPQETRVRSLDVV